MKTLVSIFVAGALSSTGAFAGAAGTSPAGTSPNVAGNDNVVATPRLPFRPVNKRPSGTAQASVTASKVNVGSPRLPFRHYQKQPMSTPENKRSGIEATNRK